MRLQGIIPWVAGLSLLSACLFETGSHRHPVGPEIFQYVGEPSFSPPGAYAVGLEVDSEGRAYAAFTDASDSGRVAVMGFTPSSGRWDRLGGGLSRGAVYMLDMGMDPAGLPYLAFKDDGDSMRVSVLRWDPDSLHWARLGRGETTPTAISEFALALGPAGEVYLGFKDWEHGDRPTVLLYDRSGDGWKAVGDSGFTDAESNFMSLAVDRAGTPYLGYYDELRTGRASVMRYAGPDEGWLPVGELGFSRAQASSPLMALDPDGTPYLGYLDGFDNAYKTTVRRFVSGAWTPLGEESFSTGQALSPSFAISSEGKPHFAFINHDQGGALDVLGWDGSAEEWRDVGGAVLDSTAGRAVALAFGPGGKPWIAFLEKDDARLSVMRLSE